MEKLKMQTKNKVDINIETIGNMFPNTVTETIRGYDENNKPIIEKAIDFDILKQELSKVIVEGKEERYQMNWPGKKEAILMANAPINKTLRPCREESVDFDKTENLYIEGDNLEVLKLLQETYLNKVKMIYIDPPYNTGKDTFVYNDDFAMSSEEFSEVSGQYDEDGNMNYNIRKNSESNGRYHTDWINMMYSRLKLAKDLLSDDGVSFISIDDTEIANLKKICDEIFGSQNFITLFNRKGSGGRQDSKHYAIVHEYLICYAKNKENYVSGKEQKEDDSYPFYDDIKKKNYKTQLLRKWGENSKRSDRPNLFYPIIDPDGNQFYPMLSQNEEGCWRWGKEKMKKEIEDGSVEFKKRNNDWVAYEKIFEPEDKALNTKLYTTWIDNISSSSGTTLIKELFNSKVFGYPKPVDFIYKILKLANVKDSDIVLDFFSGSATTAHAVMQLNIEDDGNRKFIMAQIPDETDEKSEAFNAGYKNICEIGKERIRRAGKKIKEENSDKADDLDIGFRVLKVDSSNMKEESIIRGIMNKHYLIMLKKILKKTVQSKTYYFK